MNFNINGDKWKIIEISNAEMIKIENVQDGEFVHGVTRYIENIIYINKETPNKEKTLYHELMHMFLYEYGHNQFEKKFDNEDLCEISACSHNIIHKIVNDYKRKIKTIL